MLAIKPVHLDKARQQQTNSPLTTDELRCSRSLLASLLWATQTREDIFCEVVHLQLRQLTATIADLVAANALLLRAQKHVEMMGDVKCHYAISTCVVFVT